MAGEGRRAAPPPQRVSRRRLIDARLETLRTLEHFGWALKFVRRPPFEEPIPMVFDGERKKYAVLRADGTLDEHPGLDIRR